MDEIDKNENLDKDKEFKREVTNRIKELRKKQGLTQEKVAEIIDMEYNTYVKMENAYNMPSLKNLVLLSDLFNVSIDYIVVGNDNKTKANKNDYDKFAYFLNNCEVDKLEYLEDTIHELIKLIGNRSN